MIEILGGFILDVLKKISEKAIDYGSNDFSKRRNVLSHLLRLYNSVRDLEEVSISLSNEFIRYADGRDVATKVVSARKMEELNAAYKVFLGEIKSIDRVIEIYDEPLAVSLRGAMSLKSFYWKQIDLSYFIIPKMAEVDSKKSFTLTTPTSKPKELGGYVNFPNDTHQDLEVKSPLIKKQMIDQFKIVEIDIRNRDELSKLMNGAEKINNKITAARTQLGNLIRQNFSLDKIIL